MGVMRSRARPGAYRSVRALAWWSLVLSRTTAVFFFSSVSRARRPVHEGGSARRSGLPGSGRFSSSWSSGSAPRRTTGSPSCGPRTALPSPLAACAGSRPRAPRGPRRRRQASQPSWSRSLTWSRISAIRLAMAFSSRRPTNGSGSLRLMLGRCMSSRSGGLGPVLDSEPDRTRRPQGAGASQKPAPAPASEGGLLRISSSSSLLRPLEPRRAPAHGVTGHHEGPAWPAATATATRVPSPQSARPSPRQYPGRRRGQRTQSPPPSILTSLQVSERFFHLMRMSCSSSVMSIRMKQSCTRCSADTNQKSRSSRPRIPFYSSHIYAHVGRRRIRTTNASIFSSKQ